MKLTVPPGTTLTVIVMNHLPASSTVSITVDGVPTAPLQVPANRVWYNLYTTKAGGLGVAVTDDQGTPLFLSGDYVQVGGGSCHYIGAGKTPAGLYTDVTVVLAWPSRVV
jgi:hypothetical protein